MGVWLSKSSTQGVMLQGAREGMVLTVLLLQH